MAKLKFFLYEAALDTWDSDILLDESLKNILTVWAENIWIQNGTVILRDL